ncbi:MAG: FHA domain-containing protein [Thermoguttaceae bacterium]|jgi:pSer/pThr/pTyr-binding forkhead associated (FHA) protein|nr:FHA domain-containing protein [Thermoguttaceae bacterium]
MMDIKLTISSDEKEYFSQSMSLPCVIGRARQCGVAILHPVVSRQHCEIYEQDGDVFVRDLGSLNGTVFEGERIGRGVNVPFGSEFSIGRLYFKIDHPDPPLEVEEFKSSEELRQEMDELVDSTIDKVFEAANLSPEDLPEPPAIEEDDSGPIIDALKNVSDSPMDNFQSDVELEDLASDDDF